jgi:hypothetical protein
MSSDAGIRGLLIQIGSNIDEGAALVVRKQTATSSHDGTVRAAVLPGAVAHAFVYQIGVLRM